MFFKSQHFTDVIVKLVFDESENSEDLSNQQIISLCKELSHTTVTFDLRILIVQNYFMWANRDVSYRYRDRKWLLFSPIERITEILNVWKKSIASEELGYGDNAHVKKVIFRSTCRQ
jgi:hypothetical protein